MVFWCALDDYTLNFTHTKCSQVLKHLKKKIFLRILRYLSVVKLFSIQEDRKVCKTLHFCIMYIYCFVKLRLDKLQNFELYLV